MPLGIVVVAVSDQAIDIIIMARAGGPFVINGRGAPGIVAAKCERTAARDIPPGATTGAAAARGARIDYVEDEAVRVAAAAAEAPRGLRLEIRGGVFISRLSFDVEAGFTIPEHAVNEQRIALRLSVAGLAAAVHQHDPVGA